MDMIPLFRMHTRRMDNTQFRSINAAFKINGEIIETDEAIAVTSKEKTAVYAQPGSRFAGLFFSADHTTGMVSRTGKLVEAAKAQEWGDDFLKKFNFLTEKSSDKRINISLKMTSYQTHSVTFDGKERKKIPAKTEIASAITINKIPVVGPRAKIRGVFGETVIPSYLHCCLPAGVEFFEEKNLLDEKEVIERIKKTLDTRRPKKSEERPVKTGRVKVNSARLAYFAGEYTGGPDLLAPFYFIEIEEEDRNKEKTGVSDGIKQLIKVPAFQ